MQALPQENSQGTRGPVMARREWARSSVSRFQLRIQEHGPEPLVQVTTVATLLQAEHARSVRIVKAEIRRVKLNEHIYGVADQIIIVTALERILAAIQQGRGKGGKG